MRDTVIEITCQRATDDRYLCTEYTNRLKSVDLFVREMNRRYRNIDLRITIDIVRDKK